MHQELENLSTESQRLLRPENEPKWTDPMLATPAVERFSDPEWIYERKFDGERCMAMVGGEHATLVARNRQSLDASYPEVVRALSTQPCRSLVCDGEIVAFEGAMTSYSRLQKRIQANGSGETTVPVVYYVFDLLHLDGFDATRLPLRDRKNLLKRVLRFRDPLRFTPHRNADGEQCLENACRSGWEGVVAKDAAAPYTQGRSKKWLKFKCVQRQELVIGGYTTAKGGRIGFGSILVGYFDGADFVYAGKVDVGFDDETLVRLKKQFDRLEQPAPAFNRGRPNRGHEIHWISPELVTEVGFTEWTADGRLNHPRFLGMRRDKAAAEVRREASSL